MQLDQAVSPRTWPSGVIARAFTVQQQIDVASQIPELTQLASDVGATLLEKVTGMAARTQTAVTNVEEFTDLVQLKTEVLGPLDEAQPRDVLVVEPAVTHVVARHVRE